MVKKVAVMVFAAFVLVGFVYAQEEVQEGNGAEYFAEPVPVNGEEPAAVQVWQAPGTIGVADQASPRTDLPLRMEISAEMKTGVFWDSRALPEARMHHNDDAGGHHARLRLDMGFWYENLGVRVRFHQDRMGDSIGWEFAYAYGNFLDNRLRISLGQLGVSPWEWGGSIPRWMWAPHDMRSFLDAHRKRLDDGVGIRTEIMPMAVPGLSFGFTLNQWDNGGPPWAPGITGEDVGMTELLMETVLGVAYTNDHFHGRFSFRLDSVADSVFCLYANEQLLEGMSLMYRLEPRFISNMVPDLRVWLNGWWRGIGAEIVNGGDETVSVDALMLDNTNTMMDFRNWLYIEYAPVNFIAELRLGLQLTGLESHVFTIRPSFFYNVLPFLRIGTAFRYEYNFGAYAGGAFWGGELPPHPEAFNPAQHFFAVEPQLRIHFGPTYFAFVYGFEGRIDNGNLTQRHWINLRTTISF